MSRIIYKADIDTNSTVSEHSHTDSFLSLVPQNARLQPLIVGENTEQDIEYISILGPNALQATKCAVQISGKDNSTDSQLRIDIQGSIDGLVWEQISQVSGYAITSTFDVTGYAMIRAKTTTAASAGTQATVSFMMTRTP